MLAAVAGDVAAQIYPGGILPPPRVEQNTSPVRQPITVVRTSVPAEGEYVVRAVHQEVEGAMRRLRVKSSIETTDTLLEADEIDYDSELGIAEARGSVHFVSFVSGEQLWAERIEYSFNQKSGTFYKVRGSMYGKIDPRPGLLMTSNPFIFSGEWAERLGDHYYLYKGTITNCSYPNPWWTLKAPKFDIVPNQRAIAYKALYKLKGIPLLYSPALYKALSNEPRKSGFLTPNFGNSNRRGLMIGIGYYWAINRSYDVFYRPQYFSQRGFAHMADFRGKPTQRSDFNAYVYGVNDRGLLMPDGSRVKQGGYLLNITGKADYGKDWYARGAVNYLSNFTFRQAFTESFNEAVFSEVNSIVVTGKNWSSFHFNALYGRQENFQSEVPGDTILIRRLPQLEFDSRDRQVTRKAIPVWVSWNTTAGLMHRTQPLFQTRQFVERIDVEPRVMTAFHWKDIHLVPSFSVRNTYYGESFSGADVTGDNLNRFSREVNVELILPAASRVYGAPKWMGSKVKHSIESRALYRRVDGVRNFNQIIRFDELDVLTDTNELEISIANRLWTRTQSGEIRDWLRLEVAQRRFFDPTFGGALVAGQRNVFTSSIQMTGHSFLDQPRNYSPVVSSLRMQPLPAFGLEWRTDYDPLRGKLVNASLTADARVNNYFFSLGHNKVSCIPLVYQGSGMSDPCQGTAATANVLSPPSNQFRGMVGLGQESRRGWNAGFLAIYDYKTGIMQYANTQITYNTDCCAFSGQYRRFNFGARNENQFRVALVIANIGSFGTLRRQERLF